MNSIYFFIIKNMNLYYSLGFPNFPPTATSATTGSTTPSSTNTQTNTTTSSSTTTSSTSAPPRPPVFPNLGQNPSNYFSQMLNMMANNTIVSCLHQSSSSLSSSCYIFNSFFFYKFRVNHLNKDTHHNLISSQIWVL